jgi:hypothetical protein
MAEDLNSNLILQERKSGAHAKDLPRVNKGGINKQRLPYSVDIQNLPVLYLFFEKKDDNHVSGTLTVRDMASVNRSIINTFYSRAQVIIRHLRAGTIRFMAEAKGLKTRELTIQVKK